MAAAPLLPQQQSFEDFLASIPGLHKEGAAPPAAAAAPRTAAEAKEEAAPAAKRARKGKDAPKGKAAEAAPAKDADVSAPEAGAAAAAAAGAAMHNLSGTEAVATILCPAGVCHTLNTHVTSAYVLASKRALCRRRGSAHRQGRLHHQECARLSALAIVTRRSVTRLLRRTAPHKIGIQGLSSASVQVAKEVVGANTREVSVRGAPASVATAQALITSVIEQAVAAKSRGPRGGSGGEATATMTEPRVEARIPCAADRIGWVIGAGGATVKAIRALSGAQIDMLEEVTETGGRRGVVVVTGAAEEVEQAKMALAGLLGAAHSAASKAYAAQLLQAAEARCAWDEEQRRGAALPEAAPPPAAAAAGGEAGADGSADVGGAPAGDGDGAGAAAAAQAASGWRQVVTKHPDGSELRYWLHEATGVCRW